MWGVLLFSLFPFGWCCFGGCCCPIHLWCGAIWSVPTFCFSSLLHWVVLLLPPPLGGAAFPSLPPSLLPPPSHASFGWCCFPPPWSGGAVPCNHMNKIESFLSKVQKRRSSVKWSGRPSASSSVVLFSLFSFVVGAAFPFCFRWWCRSSFFPTIKNLDFKKWN